mgnify:CR=1 FL=1
MMLFGGAAAFNPAIWPAASEGSSGAPVAAPAPELVESALKTVSLSNAAGDSVTVYTFGACITSYVKGGTDVLAVRPDAKLDGSKPISGGIPFCWSHRCQFSFCTF